MHPLTIAENLGNAVSRDLNTRHDPTGQLHRERVYFGRFLVLGAFRYVSHLPFERPELSPDEVAKIGFEVAGLLNDALERQYRIKNLFPSNQSFIIAGWGYEFTKKERNVMFYLDGLKLEPESRMLATALILGCMMHLEHFKTLPGVRAKDIENEQGASLMLLNRYLRNYLPTINIQLS